MATHLSKWRVVVLADMVEVLDVFGADGGKDLAVHPIEPLRSGH